MKLRFVSLGFFVILIFVFSGSALANNTSVKLAQKQNSTTLTVWYYDDGNAGVYLKNQIDQFASTNGISINATRIDPSVFPTLLDQYFYNDSFRPDLIEVRNDWVPQFVTKNYIIPVDSDLNTSNTFVDASLRALSYYISGTSKFQTYAFPYSMDTIMGFANTKILSNNNAPLPPNDSIWSWSDWLQSVSLANNQINITDPHYGFSFTDAPGSFDAFLYGMGGRLFTDLRVDKSHYGIESNASISALQLASDVVNARHLTPILDLMGTNSTRTLFGQGKVAVIFDYFSGLNYFLNSTAFKSNNNLAVFQVPEIQKGSSGAPLVVDGFAVTSQASGDVLAKAKSLALLLTGTDVQQGLTTNYLKIPARVDALQAVKDNTIYKAFFWGLSRSYQIPISNFWYYAITNYADRIWVFLRGEPALASQAALGIKVFLDQVPLKDNSPLYKPAGYPSFFPGTSSTGGSSPGFESFILIPILLAFSIMRKSKRNQKKI